MMEKGKNSSHGEEDDFLQHLMDCQPSVSSPLPPLPPRPRNTIQNKLIDDEIRISNHNYNRNSPTSDLQGNCVMNEIKDSNEEFLFKFLTMTNSNISTNIDDDNDGSSKLPPISNVAQADDNYNDLVASMIIPPEMVVQPPPASSATTTTFAPPRRMRKVLAPEMLAHLSMFDPKKAKRIIANRMSAVRAKERKKLYAYMLAHKSHALQCESNTLNAHLSLLQTESLSLNAENVRLKEQTSMILQQIHLQESLNEEIRNEIQHLKMLTQIASNHRIMFNNTGNNYEHNNLAMHAPLGTEQFLQAQNPFQQFGRLHFGVQKMNLDGQQYSWQVQGRYEDVNPYNCHLQQQENPPIIENPNITNPLPHLQDQENNDN